MVVDRPIRLNGTLVMVIFRLIKVAVAQGDGDGNDEGDQNLVLIACRMVPRYMKIRRRPDGRLVTII